MCVCVCEREREKEFGHIRVCKRSFASITPPPRQHSLEKAETGYPSYRRKERAVNECSALLAVPDAIEKSFFLLQHITTGNHQLTKAGNKRGEKKQWNCK